MCGIYAIYSKNVNNNNIIELKDGMKKLQHRGKDSYGISMQIENNISSIKRKGEIKNSTSDSLKGIKCSSCLGHLRYSTSGYSSNLGKLIQNEIQPLRGCINNIHYALTHNGNIPNVKGHDTTYINNKLMNNSSSIESNLIDIMNEIPAAYSIVILINNDLYVMRDRYGIRPLCIGQKDNNFHISSESVAFSNEINYIRDVKPGEILKINENGIQIIYNHPQSTTGLCLFEILYFLNENSFTDGMYIKNLRKQFGKTIALEDKQENFDETYTVVGIPLTGICLGKSYAKELNLKYSQLITKNKKVSRSFIAINNEERKKICDMKFIYNATEIKGKKLIIVDDTIVRGNVIKSIINKLYNYGAKEIHVRIPAPPVIDICELGISIQSKKELIMYNRTINDVCKEIKATSLKYLSIDKLKNIPKESYDQCFSGFISKDLKIFKET